MHNIQYYDYDENIKRDYVQRELDSYVKRETYQEGGHGLDKPIRWLDDLPVYDDREMAEKAIENRDRGWYDQLAVRYYEPIKTASKGLSALEEKAFDLRNNYAALDRALWTEGMKAEFVGCRECGSKLSRVHIHSNRCPVCGKDLRPESTLARIRAAKDRWEKACKAVKDYVNSHSKKKVKWLVKIEYHT